MKIKDIDGHFFLLEKCCLIYMPKGTAKVLKGWESRASIMVVLVAEAVAPLAASLPGSG